MFKSANIDNGMNINGDKFNHLRFADDKLYWWDTNDVTGAKTSLQEGVSAC